ncbi:MAG: tetratricopeptide repeat protein, partial [Planctomycetales bacterium]|nr:tetratricopeptide repeat protein [Planctomycetales bacterium]
YEQAAQELSAWRQTHATLRQSGAFLRTLADALAGRGDHAEAIETLEVVLQDEHRTTMTSTERAVTLYRQAQSLLALDHNKQADEVLSRIRTSSLPKALLARIEYARAEASMRLLDLRSAELSLAEALAAVRQDSTFADRIRWKQIDLLTRRTQINAASDIWRNWEPHKNGVWFYRASMRQLTALLEAAEDWHGAEQLYSRAFQTLSEDDDRAECLLGVSRCLRKTAGDAAAAPTLIEFAQLFPAHEGAPDALLAAADAYRIADKNSLALSAYQRFLQHYPDEKQAWRAAWGTAVLLEQDNPAQAADVLVKALAKPCPTDAVARLLYRLAWNLDRIGQREAALAAYQKLQAAGDTTPYWADATYRLAQRAFQRGDYRDAMQEIEKLLSRNADDNDIRIRPYALFLKAQIAMAQSRWQDGRQVLEALLSQQLPASLQVAVQLATADCAYRSADFPASRQRLESLNDAGLPITEEQRRWIDLRLAQIEADEGDWESCLQVIAKLLPQTESQTTRVELLLLMARSLTATDREADALLVIHEAKRIATDQDSALTAEVHWALGELLLHKQAYAEALESYSAIRVEVVPELYDKACLRAAACHVALGQIELASELFRRVATTGHDDSVRETAAKQLEQLRVELRSVPEPELPVSWQSDPPEPATTDTTRP